PIEEQKKELPGFLKTLSREQVEFLKRQQGTSCPYCAIAEGKIEARKVYEDENLIGALEINPANKGHVVLFPKKHYEILNQIEDVGHLFNIAKRISGAIFESVKAEGTNIFVSNGASAGQTVPHVAVHIVPRFKDD
ncbi:MAG: HIT domain-containing protein, partial [Nanoarchaeota archaeon]